ncbi:MAG: HAD-IC family P-type ATPase [Coriobacteriia bacterium]|nr:HAD-IC family P-type ATPase [Coriobacteriia bacterium]
MNTFQGLTSEEVQSRQDAGLDNSYVANPSKSNWDIVRSNTFTLFNVTSFIIAIAVLAVGSFINSLFILLIIFNIALGISVEIRSRNIIDKLTLLNTDPVLALRDNRYVKVLPKDIVMGDVLMLQAGDQVPTDSVVIAGYVEVNEALLTGESDLLTKQAERSESEARTNAARENPCNATSQRQHNEDEAKLLSGSFIASGQCHVRVEHVGADNYSTRLSIEAKQYRPLESGLMRALGAVMKFVSWIALPLGILLLIQALFISHVDTSTAVLATTAGILGMIPRGMVVLIAVTLVAGVVKLGLRKVLVQEMYSIETMAHMDTLCLDKTGTITEGKMHAVDILTFGDYSEEYAHKVLRTYLSASTDNNSTMQALREAFGDDGNTGKGAVTNTPFSSQRKWGAVDFSRLAQDDPELLGLDSVVLGAPENLLVQETSLIDEQQKQGYRVLLLGHHKGLLDPDNQRLEVTPIACIMLDDPVRESAAATLAYLREQGADLKIVSGDNPKTVSTIAKRAGFEGHEHYVDASKLDDDQLVEVLDNTAIFGRVSPQQKRLIVASLRQRDKTVGMIGDGVNDILAMREANLSVAMAAGDAAAKQIANIVLLKSDFSDMPEILYEARRVVNNMLRSASIFFIKTIYSLLMVLASSASMLAGGLILFPFVAIQVTLADQTIGWPTFVFSFRQDKKPVQKEFLKTALLRALPNAVLITASFIFVHFYGQAQNWSSVEMVTLMYCCLGVITFYNVVRACLPLTWFNFAMLTLTIVGYFVGLLLIGPFIGLGTLTAATAPVFAAITVISLAIWLLWQRKWSE